MGVLWILTRVKEVEDFAKGKNYAIVPVVSDLWFQGAINVVLV
jgi:hypothetical protein